MQKRNIRAMTWNDYDISKNRYKELQYFCRQYDEKKSKIAYGVSGTRQDGMPRGTSASNPTEQIGMSNVECIRDCLLIEQSAFEATSGVSCLERYILKSVTMDLNYSEVEWDKDYGKIPVCEKDFYGYRRLFYSILNKLKLDRKSSI